MSGRDVILVEIHDAKDMIQKIDIVNTLLKDEEINPERRKTISVYIEKIRDTLLNASLK